LLTIYSRDLRLKQIIPYLRGRVLDVGCGYTSLPDWTAVGQGYTGIDNETRAIEVNRKRYPIHSFELRDIDCEPFKLGRERFGTVLLMAVLEHLGEPEKVLQECCRYLEPGGRVVITTPTPLGEWVHHWGSRMGLFSRMASEQHRQTFQRQSLEATLAGAGLQMVGYRRFMLGMNQLALARRLRAGADARGRVA